MPDVDEPGTALRRRRDEARERLEARVQAADDVHAGEQGRLEIVLPMLRQYPAERGDADDDRTGAALRGIGRRHAREVQRDRAVGMRPLGEHVFAAPVAQAEGCLAVRLELGVADVEEVGLAEHEHRRSPLALFPAAPGKVNGTRTVAADESPECPPA